MNDVKLYVLGSRGSYPVINKDYEIFGGHTSSYIIKDNDYALIIDCGTGLVEAKELLKDCKKVDILLTHVHYDHILGLLKNDIFALNSKVDLYGTFNLWFSSDFIKEFFKKPFWPINYEIGQIHDFGSGEELLLNGSIKVKSFKSGHPDNTSLFSIELNNKKICILFDYDGDKKTDISFINNCDYLLYDGMFDKEDYKEHNDWGHSTYEMGCVIAKEYGVKYLLVTHLNPSYNDKKLLDMEQRCQNLYKNSRFARCNDEYDI